MDFPLLKDLGLNENEAEIYELFLKEGRSKVRDILGKTDIKRANIYHILQSLQDKNLLLAYEGKQTEYEVQDPSNLWKLIQDKEKRLKQTEAVLQGTLPLLTSLYNKTAGKPAIQVFEGVEGVKKALKLTLNASEGVDAWLDGEILLDPTIKDINTSYIKERLEQGISKRILTRKTERSQAGLKPAQHELTKTRFIDSTVPAFNASVQLFGNTSILISIDGDKLISLVIEDETMTTFLKALFESIWKQSTE
jgi:sugar-specific transcriptional regulator TrmB